jgi:hypothetical protein
MRLSSASLREAPAPPRDRDPVDRSLLFAPLAPAFKAVTSVVSFANISIAFSNFFSIELFAELELSTAAAEPVLSESEPATLGGGGDADRDGA